MRFIRMAGLPLLLSALFSSALFAIDIAVNDGARLDITSRTSFGIDMDNPDSSMWIKLYKMAVSKWMWCSWMHLLPSRQTGYPTNTWPYYLRYTILSQLEPWLHVGLAVHSASCWMGGSCNNGFNLVKDKKFRPLRSLICIFLMRLLVWHFVI